VTGQAGDDRLARAALTYLAEPADALLGDLLQVLPPAAILAAVRSGTVPADATEGLAPYRTGTLSSALARWRDRLTIIPPDVVERHAASGIQMVCPGDPGWPPQLDDLGATRPYALWLRGTEDLQSACIQSVAIIGARAATAYGRHVCTQIAADLAERGWTVVSGGAYGIDACAHQAALAAGRPTIAVLACGPDVAYPAEHRGMLDTIAACGVVLSESPPGSRPTRSRFLLRNRIITALGSGTVVIEAGMRSGSMAAARQAEELGRPLMAVPGPVTSAMSAACHELIRELSAVCVTSAADVVGEIPPF
jgi:DNA processing protein